MNNFWRRGARLHRSGVRKQALLTVFSALLGSMVLSGCGGSSFHGTLGGGTGTGPTPEAGEPVVTGLSPFTVAAGGPGFTLTVTGKSFAQGDTVEWNSYSLKSTFISSSQMTAQVPNQLISYPTSVSIIVQPPVAYSLTFGTNITVNAPPAPGTSGFTLSTVNVQANDIVWDPVSQRIFLSVTGMNPTNPNTVTALDPVTGQFGASAGASSGADRLAVSSDGSWLYAGTDPDGSVRRFTLPGLTSDITIPLGSAPSGQPYYALDLKAAPGNPNTIAVSRFTNHQDVGGVVIYDGSNPRAESVSSIPGPNVPLGFLAWNGAASDVYATYSNASLDTMFVLSVNSDGVQLAQSNQLTTNGDLFTLGAIHYSALTGYIYGDGGSIFDPSSNSLVNTLPLAAVEGGLNYSNCFNSRLTLDDDLGVAWAVGQPAQSQQYLIEAFDLRTNALLGSIAIPNVVGVPVKFIRWGSTGLAFLTNGCGVSGPDGPEQGDGVYLISGAFVTTPSTQMSRPTVLNR
jgi:hypothetical protein